MTQGFLEEAQSLGIRHNIVDDVTSDSTADQIEAAIARRMTPGTPFDGILTGSPSSAVAAVAGAEKAGRRIGQDYDIVAKEANHFLHRFRKEIIVVEENLGRAGSFLTRALIAAVERRAPERGQYLDRPDHVDFG
jgi:LacI family transcriptional regulator